VLPGCDAPVFTLSPGRVACRHADRSLRIVDLADGREPTQVRSQAGFDGAFRFIQGTSDIVAVGADQVLRRVRADGTEVFRFGPVQERQVAISDDGHVAATGAAGDGR
jgi:hypothetical protein